MSQRPSIVLFLLTACAQQSPVELDPVPKDTGATTTGTTTGTTMGTTTGTTTGTTPPFTWDCSLPLPTLPVTNQAVGYFSDAEDFDFDAFGNVVVVYQSALVLKNRAGDYTNIISPNISSWTSGTRVLSTGDYVVADSSSGSITRVDHATGSQVDLASNFQWPNSIDVGANDDLYISDFTTGEVVRMNAWNPDDNEFIGGGLDQANGVALSPDEQTLYVIESWKATVVAFDRDPGGNGWNGPRMIVYIPNGNFQGLNVDYCGNLYITDVWIDNQDYSNILRATPDGASVEIVTQIPSWYVPNLRFGTDIGGWVRTSLYASDRDLGKIYEFDVGMPGRAHPAIP